MCSQKLTKSRLCQNSPGSVLWSSRQEAHPAFSDMGVPLFSAIFSFLHSPAYENFGLRILIEHRCQYNTPGMHSAAKTRSQP